MKWFGWFRSNSGSGALSNPDKGDQDSAPSTYTNAANVNVTDERAMQISAFFACVRLLVQTGSTLPLGFYTRTEDGREPLDPDHQLIRLLKYKPNAFMTAKAFRQAMFTSRVMWGNAYAKIERSGNTITALTPLKPAFMSVERGDGELIYKYSTDKGVRPFSQSEIFHLKGFSSDGILGLSPLGYARESLGLSISADNTAGKSIGGRPNGVLESDDFLTETQRQQLRELYGDGKISAEYRSDGGLLILPGGLKYRAISMPPDDLQLLESRQFQVPEICRFFGVPSVMIDGAAGATAAWPASYEQQVLSFLTFGLKPYLEEWEDTIVDALLKPSEKRTVFAEHRVDGLLRTDSAARSQFYSTMAQNGIMTRNEIRTKENLKPMEGGDELTVQVNLTDVKDLPKVNDTGNTNDSQRTG